MSRIFALALLASQAGPTTAAQSLTDMARSGAMPTFAQVLDARFSTIDRRQFDSFANWAKNLTAAERALWLVRDSDAPDGTPQWRSTVECAVLDSRGLARAMIATLNTATDRPAGLARWREVDSAYTAGIALEQKMTEQARRKAVRRPTPIGRELAVRVASDQSWRRAQFKRKHDEAAAEAIVYRTGSRMCHIDASNMRWLKKVIALNEWPVTSRDGKDAANDAWLIAQHADDDKAFQERVLVMMQPLVASGEASGKNYALLYDRVATSTDRPQRYATQFEKSDGGCLKAMKTEDPAGVDARRQDVGLGSLVSYAKRLSRAYHTKVCANLFRWDIKRHGPTTAMPVSVQY